MPRIKATKKNKTTHPPSKRRTPKEMAELLALQSLASTSQPGLRLPLEVLQQILTTHFEDHCQPPPIPAEEDDEGQKSSLPMSTPIPRSLLLSCKLFHRILTPLIYEHVTLEGRSAYLRFIQHGNLEGFGRVRKVTIFNLDMKHKTFLRCEEKYVKELEYKAEMYRDAVEERSGGRYTWAWPKGVEMELRATDSPTKLVDVGYIPRLAKLFSIKTLDVPQGDRLSGLVYTFNPCAGAGASSSQAFTIPEIYSTMSHLDPRTFLAIEPNFDVTNTSIASHDLYPVDFTLRHVTVQLDALPESEPESLHAVIDVLAGALEIDDSRNASFRAIALESFTMVPRERPHMFCSAEENGEQTEGLRYERLKLACCPGQCRETKTWQEDLLNRFLRSTTRSVDFISEIIHETRAKFPDEVLAADDQSDLVWLEDQAQSPELGGGADWGAGDGDLWGEDDTDDDSLPA